MGLGFEDEAAFVLEGVGDDKFLAGDDLVAEEEEVDVDGAGFPFVAAGAAEGFFDFQGAVKEGVRAEGGLDFGGGV